MASAQLGDSPEQKIVAAAAAASASLVIISSWLAFHDNSLPHRKIWNRLAEWDLNNAKR
jgi:hypothetical protein